MGLMSYKRGFAIHNPFPIDERNQSSIEYFKEESENDRLKNSSQMTHLPYMKEYAEPSPPMTSFREYLKEVGHPVTPFLEDSVTGSPPPHQSKPESTETIIDYTKQIFSEDLAKKIGQQNKQKKQKKQKK